MIRVKAVYENRILKPLEKLELEEGEEVEIEIELKRRGEGKKRDILSYAGLLKDLNDEEERLLEEAVKRRALFGRALNL